MVPGALSVGAVGAVPVMAVEPVHGRPRLRVGVLELQGAFLEHKRKLGQVAQRLSGSVELSVSAVKTAEHVEGLDGLIIPGGESTTMGVFLGKNNFAAVLQKWLRGGGGDARPGVVWGTCAGLILLANRLEGEKDGGQTLIGGLQVTVSRNMYGRQVDSFEATLSVKEPSLFGAQETPDTAFPALDMHGTTEKAALVAEECRGIFIRAPRIRTVDSSDVKVLATLREDDGHVVAVQQGNVMATAFHPELTEDLRWHVYFVTMVLAHRYPDLSEKKAL